MTRVSLVLVNYRTARLVAKAIGSARSAASQSLEVVVVDNSGDAAEHAALETLAPDRLIDAPDNPGYGGGANLGVAASSGELVVIANPDVEFGPRSIDLLVETASIPGVGVAGPRFTWDAMGHWLLPHPEVPTPRREIARVLAGRSAAMGALWRRARQRERIRTWGLERRTDVEALSGAVLCLRRATFDAIGGFDASFRLYFEEIDLAVRLRRAGLRVVYDPRPVCNHAYAQSAAGSEGAANLFLESEERFLTKWYGRRFARVVLGARRPVRPEIAYADGSFGEAVRLPRGRWLAEASPLADMSTAAGSIFEGETVRLPEDVVASYRGTEIFFRVYDLESGTVAASVRLVH